MLKLVIQLLSSCRVNSQSEIIAAHETDQCVHLIPDDQGSLKITNRLTP